ncbi:MAG TPA: hypothetical protein VM554_11655 [Acidisarcina sp.]|nr:hypothetical protein [Acidisarcina sp.]
MFEQAVIPVQDQQRVSEMNAVLESTFAASSVARFLKRVQSAGLRVRDFEGILSRGLLGPNTAALYGALVDSDRGQVRERYLALVERVALEHRAKYLKVYAYY